MPPRRKRENKKITNMEEKDDFVLHLSDEEKKGKAGNEQDSIVWGGDDFSLHLSEEEEPAQVYNKANADATFIISKKSNETEKGELPRVDSDGETNKPKISPEKQSEAKVVKRGRKKATGRREAKKATDKQGISDDVNVASVETAESQEKSTKGSDKVGSDNQNKSDKNTSDHQPDMTENKSNAPKKRRGKRGGDKESKIAEQSSDPHTAEKTPDKSQQHNLRRRNVTGTKEKEKPATTKQSDDDLKEPVVKKKRTRGKGVVASETPLVEEPSTAQHRRGRSSKVQPAVPTKQAARSKKTIVHVEHCTS